MKTEYPAAIFFAIKLKKLLSIFLASIFASWTIISDAQVRNTTLGDNALLHDTTGDYNTANG